MKQEILELRKLHREMWNSAYPGYPYCFAATVDMGTREVRLTTIGSPFHRKTTMEGLGQELSNALANKAVETKFGSRGNWLEDQHWDIPEAILNGKDKDFWLSNIDITKLYFAMWSAMFKYCKSDAIIFGILVHDGDYVDVKVFESGKDQLTNIKTYVQECIGGK